MYAHCVVE